MATVKFRPHHFLCAYCFEGKGYSPSFVKNFYEILSRLESQQDQVHIEVVEGLDDICSPCPNHPNAACQFEQNISVLDQAHAEILQIQAADSLTWPEAKKRIKTHMTLEKFHKACASCGWKALGVCESKLAR